mgnify:CR=1 FL=1|jgi:dTDP-4-dehydrorhamnose reductase
MKVALTGATGQVGQEIQRLLTGKSDIDLVALDRNALDLSQPDQSEEAIRKMKPDVVINTAAYTAVDKAEEEPELAALINGKAPGALARGAAAVGAKLIHISTDYVFDGGHNTPYRETDLTQPLGSYGRSKQLGEELAQQECDRTLILRTAWVYGARGHGNFVKTMLRLGKEREALKVVYDQIGSPTWSVDIARTIIQLLPQLGPDTYGIYHYTCSGVTSWYDFAIAVFEEARQRGMSLAVKSVEPITTAEFPRPAQRPSYSVLGCEKIAKVLGSKPPHWRESLRQMIAELDI